MPAHAGRPHQHDKTDQHAQRIRHCLRAYGFRSLFLQFLSSGRYESISGRVGIDRTMGFHRIAAYVLLVFALLHPLSYTADILLFDPVAAWHRLTGMLASNRLRTGVLAVAGLIVIVGFATIRSRPFMRVGCSRSRWPPPMEPTGLHP
jgi:predicted ferric reductase